MQSVRLVAIAMITAIFVMATAFKRCETDQDCGVSGCTCQGETGQAVCVDVSAMTKAVLKCKPCSADEDCDGAFGCNSAKNVCNKCAVNLMQDGMAKCAGINPVYCRTSKDCEKSSCSMCEKTEESGIGACFDRPKYEQDTKQCATCDSTKNECPKNDCTLDKVLGRKLCESCAVEHGFKSICVTDPKSTTKSPKKQTNVCISTSWLNQNDVAHAAIRNFGIAKVLCIPGLPCGTPGHMLRDADGELVTYREACNRRSDCVESKMAVSQLSHKFEWSIYRSTDNTLSLTSLSANESSGEFSMSRIIAKMGDRLNRAGLGYVTDSVVLLQRYTPLFE